MSPVDRPPLRLQASVGQRLPIELESLPGAGMLWQATVTPPGCSLIQTDSAPTGAGVGGTALQRFVLTCDRPGQQQLRFEFKRSWEGEVRAVQSVLVNVR